MTAKRKSWEQLLGDIGAVMPTAPAPAPKPVQQHRPSAPSHAPVSPTDRAADAAAHQPIEVYDEATGMSGALTWPTEPDDYIEPSWGEFPLRIWDLVPELCGCLLTGGRGTGKTLLMQVYAARAGRPLLTVNCNSGMTADSLLGTPRYKPSVGDYLQPGPIAIAAKCNAILALDELNRAGTDVQAILNPLADNVNKGVYIPYTGERIVWENPRIIAAMNEGYAGTREVDPALRDRFETVFCEYLPEDMEVKLVCGRTRCPEPTVRNAVKAANAIRAAAAGQNSDELVMPIEFDLSPRAVMSFAFRVVHGQDASKAWREAVINRIGNGHRYAPTRQVVAEISYQTGGFAKE